MTHRVPEGRKVWGMIAKLWKENMIYREVKRELYEYVVTPAVVYNSKTWSLSVQEKRKIERSVLKWFGNGERMEEESLVKRVYQANVKNNIGRGRPHRRW